MNEVKPEKSATAKREEETLKFWQEKKIFGRSVEKPADKEPVGDFVFYDGPPFATGLPHYGHLLASTIKDVVPRYQTMRGKRVLRRWGWDCHGLPIENLVEKELGLKTKRDIETLGINNFNQKARESVFRYAAEWQKTIPRLGRFVDMNQPYRTMDASYTESVWRVFKTLYDKGLVYEGYKSMHLCPRCGTTLANFEVNQGYKDITDLSVCVKFELVNPPSPKATDGQVNRTYLLAWTTTPWTLPGNAALAVNPNTNYVRIKTNLSVGKASNTNENLILAKDRLGEVLKDKEFEIVEEFTGEKLIGKKYKPLFDYYLTESQVYGADFVTIEEGTGIVHIAPAFGEDDMRLGEEKNLPFIQHVDAEGKMKPEVKDFAGLEVKPKDDPSTGSGQDHQRTDIEIVKWLAHHGQLFEKKKIVHSYPHCWRCDTPLLNYAANSWFVKVTDLKEKMVAHNRTVNWVPEHIKEGRFGKWLEGARDWAVSRARFWGTPLPVWRKASGEVVVIGSLAELKKYTKKSGNKYFVMRHGESENNVLGINNCLPDKQYGLTERGRNMVKEMVNSASDKEKPDIIFCSPLLRTKETALLVAEGFGIPKENVQEDARLIEFQSGVFNERPYDDLHKFYETKLDHFTKTPPGGENFGDLYRRVAEFLYETESRFQNKKILIVSHGDPATMMGAVAEGLSPEKTMDFFGHSYFQIAQFRELPFVPLPHNADFELDFHRPHIDEIELVDESGEKLTRVPEVFDVWFDSGSMPYGQAHYPFENKEWFEKNFPADFIGEGLDQTRGWFYLLLVLSTALFDKPAFQSVIVNGLVLAEDGQKMSKRLNNYPEIEPTLDKYGADALRFYFLLSPLMRGDDLNFSEKNLGEVLRRVILRLENVLAFYELYRGEEPARTLLKMPQGESLPVLDQWILARLNETAEQVTAGLNNYKLDEAARPLDDFIDDLSTWYLRRSRERFKSEDETERLAVITTTRFVLQELAKLLAPFTPFIAEKIWQVVRTSDDVDSVHLAAWPVVPRVTLKDPEPKGDPWGNILTAMSETRRLVSLALEARTKAGIKVRQPLQQVKTQRSKGKLSPEFLELIKDEVNVKEVIFTDKIEGEVALDTTITPELKAEGERRELVRLIQDLRKEQGLKPTDPISLTLPEKDEAVIGAQLADFQRAVRATAIHFAQVDQPQIVVT